MKNWLRYGPPRKWLLKLSYWLPEKYEYALVEWLYPDDAMISFKE